MSINEPWLFVGSSKQREFPPRLKRTLTVLYRLNSLRPRPNRRHVADSIFKCIFENENEWISPRISLKFIPKVRITNIPALVQIMAWRRPGDKPLSEPVMVSLLTHICVTRPQWVNRLSAVSAVKGLWNSLSVHPCIATHHHHHQLCMDRESTPVPGPLTKFQSNFQFHQNEFIYFFPLIGQITMIFCTYQDSTAAFVWAKRHCYWISFFRTIMMIINTEFGIPSSRMGYLPLGQPGRQTSMKFLLCSILPGYY